MKTREFIKDFNDDERDLFDAMQREFERIVEAMSAPVVEGKEQKVTAKPKDLRDLQTELGRRTDKMDKLFKEFHYQYEDLERKRKATGPVKAGEPAPTIDLHEFESAFDQLCKSFEGHLRWIRAELAGRDGYSDQFERVVDGCFSSLKKLEVEVDKFGSAELKKAAKKEKPLEVVPSRFLADYRALYKKERMDPVPAVEDRLKRLDSNHEFGKVTPLADAAIDTLKKSIKQIDKKTRKELIEELEKLAKDIENYDNKMFLFSRMK